MVWSRETPASRGRASVAILAFVAAIAVGAASAAGADGEGVSDWNPRTQGSLLRHSDVRGAETGYAFLDLVAFQRDNGAADRPLVSSTITGEPMLSTGSLQPAVALGMRTFLGRRTADEGGYEAGYLGVYGMTANRTITGPGDLAVAGPVSGDVLPFADAETVNASYVSSLNSAEVNAFTSRDGDRGFVDWLAGLRYVNLAEQGRLGFTCCTNEPLGPFHANYDVTTTNNLIGGQLGGRGRRSWDRWALEGWAKAGVFANIENQSQSPIVDPTGTTTVVRDARSSGGTSTAMVADLNASLVYRLNDVWGVRAGYNTIWIGDVALAPNQWDFGRSLDSGRTLSSDGFVFLHGANLGLEARW